MTGTFRNFLSRRAKRLLLPAMAVCLLLCAACGQRQTADWLPEDLADRKPAAWTVDLSEGAIRRVTCRTTDERVVYRDGDLTRTVGKGSFSGTELTLGQLPALLDGIVSWAKAQQPQLLQQEISCAYAPPGPFYNGTPNGLGSVGGRGLVYALSDKKLTPLSGVYGGSTQYGAVTIFTHEGNWVVLLDD